MAVYRTDKTKAEILSALQNNKRVILKGGPFIDQENNSQFFIVSQVFFDNYDESYNYYELTFLGIDSGSSYLQSEEDDEYFYYNPNRR